MLAMRAPVSAEQLQPATRGDTAAIGKANELAIEAAFSGDESQLALKALESKLTGQFSPERLTEALAFRSSKKSNYPQISES